MGENAQEIGHAFFELLLRCHRSEKKLSRSTGMRTEELLCIMVIHRYYPDCVKDLTEILGVEGTRTSKLLRSLELKGLITRTVSLPNRRLGKISLTSDGLGVVKKIQADLLSAGTAVLASLEPETAGTLLQLLPTEIALD
jgi:DNA-binding MarR family transcriptional regulator